VSDAIRRQVLAILESNGLSCSEVDGGYAMRFSSAVLLLGFTTVGRQTVITLRAPVLRDIPLASGASALLARLNELNCASHFGKWGFYESERLVVLEYDLLGDHLQENELMTALTTLARLADQQDDLLQREFGGRRSFETP
jgi:hypothetical protein